MNLLKHKSSAGMQRPDLFLHVIPDLFRCAAGEDFPRITPATPECNLMSEITLQG